MAVRPVQGTTDVLQASDNNNVVAYFSGSSVAVTLPGGLPRTFRTTLLQIGAGPVTITAGSGVTANGLSGDLATTGQYGELVITAYGANLFTVAPESAAGGSGTVTELVAGTNLTGGTITATGTIGLNASPALTNLNVSGTITALPIGAGLTLTAGSLVATGGSSEWTAGTVSALGNALSLNGGTIAAHQQITVAATAAGTFAVTPSLGATSVLVHGPAAGGAVVLTMGSMAVDQSIKVVVSQGATAATWALGTGFSFGASPASYTATTTAAQFDVLMIVSNLGTIGDVMAIAQGFTA